MQTAPLSVLPSPAPSRPAHGEARGRADDTSFATILGTARSHDTTQSAAAAGSATTSTSDESPVAPDSFPEGSDGDDEPVHLPREEAGAGEGAAVWLVIASTPSPQPSSGTGQTEEGDSAASAGSVSGVGQKKGDRKEAASSTPGGRAVGWAASPASTCPLTQQPAGPDGAGVTTGSPAVEVPESEIEEVQPAGDQGGQAASGAAEEPAVPASPSETGTDVDPAAGADGDEADGSGQDAVPSGEVEAPPDPSHTSRGRRVGPPEQPISRLNQATGLPGRRVGPPEQPLGNADDGAASHGRRVGPPEQPLGRSDQTGVSAPDPAASGRRGEKVDSGTQIAAAPGPAASPDAPASVDQPAGTSGEPGQREILDQLMAHADRLGTSGNSKLRVQLRPASLGMVDLRLALKDGVLTLSIAAESPQTRQMIERGLPELRAALEHRGLEVGQLSLAAATPSDRQAEQFLSGSPGAFDPGGRYAAGGHGTGNRPQHYSRGEQVADEPGAHPTRGVSQERHLVDYWA